MKRLIRLFLLLLALATAQTPTNAQVVGGTTYTVGVDFVDFAAAITAINGGISGTGTITINVPRGSTYTGVLPTLNATNTSATPIVIQASGTGPAPIIQPTLNAGTIPTTTLGANGDAVLRINGTDFITIDGLEFRANNNLSATAATRIEYGIFLVKSATNACQNITIQNCAFTNFQGGTVSQMTIAIYQSNLDVTGAAVTVTSTGGRCENNRYYGNTINGPYHGIRLVGFSSATLQDQNCEVGGLTSGTGNTITNLGQATSGAIGCVGIFAQHQNGVIIGHNTVTIPTGTTVGTVTGIECASGNNIFARILQNAVTINSGSTSTATGILNSAPTASGDSIVIRSNTVTVTHTAAGITNGINSSGAGAGRLHIRQNTVTIINNAATTQTLTGILQTGSPTNGVLISENTVTGCSATGLTTGMFRGIRPSPSVARTISFNAITNNTIGSATHSGIDYGIEDFGTGAFIIDVTNNTVSNNVVNGTTATLRCIRVDVATTATFNIFQNTVTNNSAPVIEGIRTSLFLTANVRRNNVNNLTSTVAGGSVAGIVNDFSTNSGLTFNCENNYVTNLNVTGATGGNAAIGVSILGTGASTANLYYNTIFLNTSGGTNFGSSGISASTVPTLDLRNNVVVNKSTPNGTGLTVAYRRATTTLTTYASTSDRNLFFAGTPSASRLIFHDGTNSDQTLAQFKTRVGPTRDANSVTEDPPFTNPSLNNFAIDPSVATRIESRGLPITGITTDFFGNSRSASTPDIGAEEGSFTLLDDTPPTISYTPLTNTASLANRVLTGFATITDPSPGTGINTTSGTRPRIYYKKSTDPNVFNDNTSGTPGWKFAEASNASSPFSFTIDYSLLNSAPVTVGNVIEYFVVAEDLAPTPNVGINSGTFAATPSSVALTAAAFPIGGTINSYTILTPLPTSLTVGTGGDYPTLTGAGGLFAAINANVLGGNTTVTIIDDLTEDGANALLPDGMGGFTLTIQPSGARTVSGTVAGAMLDFNGADGVTINGLNSGGNSLTISNASTATTATTIRFRNDATNNTVTNCVIEGSTTNSAFPPTAATIYIGGGVSTGNDNITISNSVVRPSASGRPTEAIVSNGTSASVANDAITITGCQIHNFNVDGIYIVGTGDGNNHTITSNSVYETASATGAQYGIYLEGATNGHTVTGNFIGGNAPNATGTWTNTSTTQIIPLFVAGGSGSNVSNNVVQNYNITATGTTSAFLGIVVGSSSGTTTVSSNTVQTVAMSGTNTGSIVGMQTQGSGNFTVSNNTVSGITRSGSAGGFVGLASISTGTTTLNGNTVSNLTQNTASGLNGITIAGTGANATLSNSTVQSLSHTAAGAMQGIAVSATGTVTVSNSTVQSLSHTGNGAITGINSSGTVTSHTINDNTVRDLSGTNTGMGALVRGIVSTAVGTLNITDNQVRNLSGASSATSTSPTGAAVAGIATSAANLTQTITGNRVDTLTATNATAAVCINGIGVQNIGSGGTIARNRVFRLSATSSGTPILDGINVWDANNWTVANNVVSITNDAGTNAVTIRGLRSDALSGTINFSYNSVFVGGSAASGAANSFALHRTSNGATLNIRNNSLFNARTGGTGAHVAIGRTGTSTYNSNFNVIFASANASQQAFDGSALTFSGWQTATSGDANSVNQNPLYHGPLNLAPLPGSPNSNAGTPIAITTDILGNARSATTPDIGAFEFNALTPTASGSGNAPTWGPIPGAFLTINSGPPSGTVTAQFFSSGRTGTLPGVTNQATEFWAVGSDVVGAFDVTFDLSGVGGVGNVNTIKLFRRSDEFSAWEDISSLIYDRQTSPNRLSVNLTGGFSEFTLGGDGDNPLPVNLGSFTGANVPRGVELRWETISETDNAGFDVRRAEIIDGVEQEWLTVASYRATPSLVGQGTTSQAHNYRYVDEGVQVGKTYRYALRSTDLNGAIHDYPQTVTVEVTRLAPRVFTYKLEQNYPNPFNPSTRIIYQIAAPSEVKVEVFDMLGRKVATLVNERKEAGEYSVNFNASGLSSGVYFYRLQTEKFVQTKKMMLLK